MPGPRVVAGVSNLAADPFAPLDSDHAYPVSTTEADFYSVHPDALASGQRLRLAGSLVDLVGDPVDETELAPITRMLLTALREHGLYIVDNAGAFVVYAEDHRTAKLDLSEDEVMDLLGGEDAEELDSAHPSGWERLMAWVNQDLYDIPVAYGPWIAGQDPASATIDHPNFEVVEGATAP